MNYVWEQRKLGDIITEYKETVDSDCTLPILTSSKTEGVILQEEHFGRKQQHDITGYNILPRNYCTYRNRSDGVDFTFNINKCCDKGIISKFYPVFSGKHSDVFFLSLVLNNSEEVVREIAYTCTGTGQKVLSFLDLQKMKVRVPNFDEQKEIAAYFESLDHLITLHHRECIILRKTKVNDWEQRKLGEMGSTFTGLSGKNKEDFGHGEAKFITYMNVFSNPVANLEMTESVEIDTKQNSVKKGDVFFTTSSEIPEEVGMSCVMPENKENIYLNSFCFGYRPTEKFDLDYLAYVLRTDSFRKEMTFLAQGISRYNISKNKVMEVSIPVPNLEEQVMIGGYFSNLDHLITLHQHKCDELQNLKKYMLQNMFV